MLFLPQMIQKFNMVILLTFSLAHIIMMTSLYMPRCVSSPHTPCPCKKVQMMQHSFTKNGTSEYIVYENFLCDHSTDTRRKEGWLRSRGLHCTQLSGKQNVKYWTKNGEEKEKTIVIKFGCELRRCRTLECKKKSTLTVVDWYIKSIPISLYRYWKKSKQWTGWINVRLFVCMDYHLL